jgi:hypothetical protein
MSILAVIAVAALVGATAELNEFDRSVVTSALSTNIYQPYPSCDDLGIDTNGWRDMTYEFTGYGLVVPTNAETVKTVTNVVETDNGHAEYRQSERNNGAWTTCAVWGCTEDHDLVKAKAATEKTVTTTVKRVYTLTITYRGKERKLVHEEIVSQTVKKYAKKEEWEEVR